MLRSGEEVVAQLPVAIWQRPQLLQVLVRSPREQTPRSEMTIRKKGHFRLRLNLMFKISCFYLCFLSSGKEGSRARILDIILASFEGVYSLDFSRHFSCVFKALLKRLIYAAFWSR